MTTRQFGAVGTLVVLVCQLTYGQEVGDTVRARQPIQLKVEAAAVATVAAGEDLRVRKVSGKWLWVQAANGQRGWLLREQVEASPPAPPPVASPTAANPPAAARTAGSLQPAAAERSSVKPADATAEESPHLTAIGVLAGQNIYTSYAYIGAIADGYGSKTYSAVQVQQLMDEVAKMLELTHKHVQHVCDVTEAGDERAAIEEVLTIFDLLSNEARALARYARTGTESDLQAYDKARSSAWPMVQELLELQ